MVSLNRRIMVQSGNQERDAVQKIPTAEKKERILVQAVEHLPSQSKALSSNTKTEKKKPNTAKKERKEGRKEERERERRKKGRKKRKKERKKLH
jgi:hypothetical protein